MKRALLYLLVASFMFVAQGQQPIHRQVQINNLSIEKNSTDEIEIKATLVLNKDFEVSANRGATLTPILRNDTQSITLPSVIVYGRKRAILSRRNNRIPEDAYSVTRRKKNKEQAISYQALVASQEWMSSAQLILETDLCGCGNAQEEVYEQLLATVPDFTPQPVIEEQTTEAVAPPKAYKKRVKKGCGNFFFPVNQTTIYPEYLQNPEELKKIHALIEDEDIQYITRITIHAYASPEGNYSNNTRLAKGRAATLKEYMRKQYQFADSTITLRSTPEDWEGFRQQVVDSKLDNKAEVLSIIDSTAEPDVKEQRLKTLGQTYIYILRQWFPVLRHIDYTVEYEIPEEYETNE